MMVTVVDEGTGVQRPIPGVQVGGKTGTAQTAKARRRTPGSSAFAPATDPQVAVAVVVENGGGRRGQRQQLAAPIAKAVMEAVLPVTRRAGRGERAPGRLTRADARGGWSAPARSGWSGRVLDARGHGTGDG